ncbi:hypothetical protein Hanom_Chr14g01261071 [Helianthus anomalus]
MRMRRRDWIRVCVRLLLLLRRWICVDMILLVLSPTPLLCFALLCLIGCG